MENHSERNQRTFKWIERQTVLIRRFNPANSVQFSCSVMPNSLQPHGLQHARLPWPSPTPRVYSNSCPLSQWCHPTISSPAIPFPSRLQSFLASGSFQMSQLFTSGGQSIGVTASTSVLPMNIQDWLPFGWTGWISLLSKGLSRVFSNTTVQNINFSALSFLYRPLSHPYMTTGKTIALTRQTFVGKAMSLLLNMLSRLQADSLWAEPQGKPQHSKGGTNSQTDIHV